MKLLNGYRVLDVSWLIPGPHTSMMLADLGADVIKVETPPPSPGDYFRLIGSGGKGISNLFIWMNRNKRSITVDFKKKEGQQLILDMAKQAHVFLEGSRPGAITKYGLDYEAVSAANPKIVYCSVSGFGQEGPLKDLASHGGAFDALSGVAKPQKVKDGWTQWRPYPHPGVTNGPWLANIAILGALLQAEKTGKGCYIDVACADAAFMSFAQEIMGVLNGQEFHMADPPTEAGSAKYTYYETRDGRFMLFAGAERHLWENFCNVVGRPDLKGRGNWSESPMGHDDPETAKGLRAELIPIFKSKTQAEWTKLYAQHGIAGAPYTDPHDYKESEHFRARQMITEHDHPVGGKVVMPSNAIKVKGDPWEISRPAPMQGEHTDEVLREFGYSDQQIAAFRSSGVL